VSLVAVGLLAIPASAQAWTAGTNNIGQLVVENDVPGDGDSYSIGFTNGVYRIGAITADAHVFGNCTVTGQLSTVECSPTGITEIVYTGSFRDPDNVHFDVASGATALIPDGVTTTVRTFKGGDIVSGSHNADHLIGAGGNDTLHGGGGADKISGGNGKDFLYGDGGIDRLLAQDGTADRVIDCGPGADHPAQFDMGLDPAPVSCG
jgi:Ca2+-binding RTX toxin-like protein